ncbi:MAG: L,D-transpeptidase [Eubacteriales bacterium]|nr:L,D-transpeptidase [Eubacteriales bacterium]
MRKHALSLLLCLLFITAAMFSLCSCSLFENILPTEIVITTPFYPTLPPPVHTDPPTAPPTAAPTRTPINFITDAPPTHTAVPLLYRIEVNIAAQVVTVYRLSDGGIEKQFICSTGTVSNPTPTGSYTIQKHEKWLSFPEFGGSWGQYTSNIVDQIWFHSLTYKSKNTYSLNNTAYGQLGSRASHGCIRLLCGDAYWIFANCAVGTKVDIVEGTADPLLTQSLLPAYRPLPKIYDPKLKSYVYWDPTDPDSSNPWRQPNPQTNPTLPPAS